MAGVSMRRTPDGRRLVVTRRVAASRDAVWDLLVDTRWWPDWGPTVRAVDCEHRRIEAGTRGRVRTVGGVWVPFEVTSCEGYRWTWDVAGVPATGHRVERAAGTVAAIEVPPLAAPYVAVCRRALRRLAELAEAE